MTLTSTAPAQHPVPDVATPHGRRLPYEPSLDGFRGLAVGAVVLYHGGVSWAVGGYLGVDAFFVLSGFLITRLLLAEWHDTGGIALVSFWGRRARRLLPALFVMLVGIALFCLFVASPDVLDQLRGDALASLFYVMNWRLIITGQSYFSQFYASPLEHMWSLAIEEQYYLIWPLVTVAIMRWKNSARVMAAMCAGLALLSALWMLSRFHPDVDPSRLYYGTDTRAQSLLIGSALAALVSSGFVIRSTVARVAVLVGAALAAIVLAVNWTSRLYTDPALYRGGFLLFGLLVALLITACTQVGRNPIRSALSFEPLRRLGLISYGVYLYHWPIYSWLNDERTGLPLTSTRLLVLRITVTLAVAIASFLLLEKPIREGALRQLRLTPTMRSLLLPVSAALVLVLLLTSTAGGGRTIPTAADFDPAKRPPPSVGAGLGGADDQKVLLVGDSVGYTLGNGFEGSVAPANHLAVWNQAVLFCELVKGAHRENGAVIAPSDTCSNWEADWRNDVDLWKPNVALLQLGAWEIFDREIDGTWITFGTPEFDAVLEPILQKAVDALSSQGAPVVVLTTPRFTRTDGTSAREWLQNDVSRTDHFNALLEKLAKKNPTKVVVIDLGSYLCPNHECRKEIDGVPMRPDGLHFREADAAVVAAWLAPQLHKIATDPARHAAPGTTPGTPAPTTTTAPPATDAPTTTEPPPAETTTEPPPTDPPAPG